MYNINYKCISRIGWTKKTVKQVMIVCHQDEDEHNSNAWVHILNHPTPIIYCSASVSSDWHLEDKWL